MLLFRLKNQTSKNVVDIPFNRAANKFSKPVRHDVWKKLKILSDIYKNHWDDIIRKNVIKGGHSEKIY